MLHIRDIWQIFSGDKTDIVNKSTYEIEYEIELENENKWVYEVDLENLITWLPVYERLGVVFVKNTPQPPRAVVVTLDQMDSYTLLISSVRPGLPWTRPDSQNQ